MFKLFKHPLFAPIRRVVTSAVYATACILYVANLILTFNTFSTTDLILVGIGTGLWGMASLHSIVRNIMLLRQELLNQHSDASNCMQRSSTHAIFNSLNHVASSSLFFAVDAIQLHQPTPAIICRLTGTALWFKSSVLGFFMAFADNRRREQNPQAEITIAGLKPEVVRLVSDIDILCAGMLYAYPIWSQGYPIKDTYHLCWMIASIIESTNSVVMLAGAYRESDGDNQTNTINNHMLHDKTISFAVM